MPDRIIKLTIQYDGTAYAGWQRQANGPSIQAAIEAVLEPIEQRSVRIVGAGRTDAGVHALGQVASLRLKHPIDASSLQKALNANLPPDIRILRASEEPPGFHAIRDARAKTYRYRIICAPIISPFERRYAWHLTQPLDVERVERAAGALVGRHDFAAFQAVGGTVRTTVRNLFDVRLQSMDLGLEAAPPAFADGQLSSLLALDFRGDGFLRHMVRSIVGTLVEIGQGRRTVESVDELLKSRDRASAGPTAPAHGLFLVRVEY